MPVAQATAVVCRVFVIHVVLVFWLCTSFGSAMHARNRVWVHCIASVRRGCEGEVCTTYYVLRVTYS